VVALGFLIGGAVREGSADSVALALLAVGVVVGLVALRQSSLRLQDRIILLEMQVRLTRLGRVHDLRRLSKRQVIALRFASDAEIPALADRAAAEQLSSKQIKQAVSDWQGDYLRT
jgi:hypothetical protein